MTGYLNRGLIIQNSISCVKALSTTSAFKSRWVGYVTAEIALGCRTVVEDGEVIA